MTSDWPVVLACAVLWWVPTFLGLADLQRRTHLPRPVVWRWSAVLGIPLVGPPLYYLRGRPALDRLPAPRRGTSRRRPR